MNSTERRPLISLAPAVHAVTVCRRWSLPPPPDRTGTSLGRNGRDNQPLKYHVSLGRSAYVIRPIRGSGSSVSTSRKVRQWRARQDVALF
jgi:hypothetical protein